MGVRAMTDTLDEIRLSDHGGHLKCRCSPSSRSGLKPAVLFQPIHLGKREWETN